MLKIMASPRSKCAQLRNQQYKYNPLTGNTVSSDNEQMKAAKRVCGDVSLCNEYLTHPTKNPWTKRLMTKDSRTHNIMRHICSSAAPASIRRQSPRTTRTGNTLQRHWEAFKDARHPGVDGVPMERDRICDQWKKVRTQNPIFPNKALGKQAVFQDVLYKYCADEDSRKTVCSKFARDPSVNPMSGRKINPDGAVAQGMRRKCAGIDRDSDRSWQTNLPSGYRPPLTRSFIRARNPQTLPESEYRPIYENVRRRISFENTPQEIDQTGMSMMRRDMDATNMSGIAMYDHSPELFPIS
ncbi:ORF_014L [Scale drop disease virus]|uniref:ORF_014L n=1 Tax=Scale drop disease virus TaxID=1697349 RepID=A0A0K1L6E2_9VIRU|nr:ORF_014L [Scale drop disease virus]AKU37429.1 ORF_014L [Scale drop disease virus]